VVAAADVRRGRSGAPRAPLRLDILDYIRKYPNAIGYVKAGIETGTDIRVVTVVP